MFNCVSKVLFINTFADHLIGLITQSSSPMFGEECLRRLSATTSTQKIGEKSPTFPTFLYIYNTVMFAVQNRVQKLIIVCTTDIKSYFHKKKEKNCMWWVGCHLHSKIGEKSPTFFWGEGRGGCTEANTQCVLLEICEYDWFSIVC